MRLISCDECGVVLDVDSLNVPHDIYHEDGTVDIELADWDGREYRPKVECPVCKSDIAVS